MAVHHALSHRLSQISTPFNKYEGKEELDLESKHVKLTPSLRLVLKGFQDCTDFLVNKSNRDEQHFEQLNKLLIVKVTRMFSKYEKDEQRAMMGNSLARMGFVDAAMEYYKFIIDELCIIAVTNELVSADIKNNVQGTILIVTLREIFWNFSDSSHNFSESLTFVKIQRENDDSKEIGIFELLVNDLTAIYEDGLYQLQVDENKFAFTSSVGILHNCARNPYISKERFRELGIVEIILPFLKSNLLYIKMLSLLAVGNMIKEDEVTKLNAGVDVFDFLLEALAEAMQSKDRKQHGFHIYEIVDGLISVARSDQNQKLIMSKSPLPMLTVLMQGKDISEILSAVKLVWELAFLEENKTIIKTDRDLMSALEVLKNTTIFDLQAAAKKAWFVIAGKDKRLHESLRQPMQLEPEDALQQHIMISYSWGDKQEVYKIREYLRSEGLPVWIDVEQMHKFPNILEGMARAIEQAYVVLVCFSEKYKNSQNCRTEGEYAYNMKKEVLPIKLQRGYSQDGWLGAFLGLRLYVEISHHYPFDKQMPKVIDALRPLHPKTSNHYKPYQPPPDPFQPPRKPLTAPPDNFKKISAWKKHDIEHWAAEHKLEGKPFKKVMQLTGEQLLFIFKTMKKSPGTFYHWAETLLSLGSIEDLMKFSRAIEALHIYV